MMKKIVLLIAILMVGCFGRDQTTKKDPDKIDLNKKNIEQADTKKTEKIDQNNQKNNGTKDPVKTKDPDDGVEKVDLIKKNGVVVENLTPADKPVHFGETPITGDNLLKFARKTGELDLSKERDRKYLEEIVELLYHLDYIDHLNRLQEQFKDKTGLCTDKVKNIFKKVADAQVIDATKIGIILPKNCRYKRIAEELENGMILAKKKLKLPYEFVIKVTDGTGKDTTRAMEELIFKDHTFMVIAGTIRETESRSAAIVAEKFNVPLVLFSKSDKISDFGKHIFNYFSSIENSADYLAKHAIEKLKMKKIAILYPTSKYGRENMIHFWRSVEKRGGKIVGVQSYPATTSDYIPAVKKLVGRNYLNLRTDYQAKKRKIINETKGYKRQKTLEALNKDIEPIIDFEAVFIPDGAKKIAMLLPYLALFDINFKTYNNRLNYIARQKANDKKHKLKFVQLLGTEIWARQVILDAAAKYAQGARFPVVYHPKIKALSKFTKTYQSTYRRPPSFLASYGYELIQVLSQATKGLESPTDIRTKITEILLLKNFKTDGSTVRFRANGQVDREMFFMKFTVRDMREAD